MSSASKSQIEAIRQNAAGLATPERAKYLQGLRDGADLCQIICDEEGNFDLASAKEFQAFLDILDATA